MTWFPRTCLAAACVALAACPRPAAAQQTSGQQTPAQQTPAQQTPAQQTPSLDQVEQLAESGHYDEARAAIAAWWRSASDPTPEDAVRAHMLRGRLAVDPDSAEADYLAVALGFPTEPQTAEALLRLGQLLVIKGDLQRAQGYLQRLAADYPGSDYHGPGLLWLARAYNAGGHRAQACSAARLGLQGSGPDPDLSSLLQLEEASSCRIGGDTVARPTETPAQPARQQPEPKQPARQPNPTPQETPARAEEHQAEQNRFSVQIGAFRQREGAEELVARLQKAGHRPRLVLVPNSGLLRVRLGHFPTAQDAADLVRRLKEEGFPAVVVGDADSEQRP